MSKQTSMFVAYIDKFFKGVVDRVQERWNDKKNEPTLMFKTMLTEEYSADLTWSASTFNHSVVAADVVSMDSSLPLKKRPTVRTASGDIAKIGIKFALKEKEISDIGVMRAKGRTPAQIAAKILNNVPRCIKGIDIRIEILFEQALSTGLVLVESDTNDGTGVRANFGFAAEHTFHAKAAAWSDATNATPIDDIQQMFDVEDNGISDVYLSKKYFDYMRKTEQVKALVASDRDQVIVNNAYLRTPTREATLTALENEFGATFHIVNNTFRVEMEDGTYKSVTPWEQGNIVGVPSNIVGRLVYGTLAEDTNRVAGVSYQKAGNYSLISEYSVNEPSLMEFTAGQALAFPVIDDGDSVFVLHADSTGTLSVDPSSLTFTSAAATKNVTVHSDNGFTATTSDAWLTVTKSGNTLKVRASANTASGATARTGSVTVTDAEDSTVTKTITVSQSA